MTEEEKRTKAAVEINRLTNKYFNVNLVTCWDCWDLFEHDSWLKEIECPECRYKDDICSFPDLFY